MKRSHGVTLQELHALVAHRPFVPLRLHLGSMMSVDVVSPESIGPGPMPRLLKVTGAEGDVKLVDVLGIERVEMLTGGTTGSDAPTLAEIRNERGQTFTLETRRETVSADRAAGVPVLMQAAGIECFGLRGTLWNLERFEVSGEVVMLHLLNAFNYVRTPRLVWRANSPWVIALDDRWWMPLAGAAGLLMSEDADIRVAATGLRPGEQSPFATPRPKRPPHHSYGVPSADD